MPAQTLEPHLVEVLRKSAHEILETMVSITPTSVEAREEHRSTFDDEVIGLLGFTGTRSGTFVVRTNLQFAQTMAAKMLMAEPEELSSFEEVSDAFGEIVNMLSGSFKNEWVAEGNQMDLSIPTVIREGNVNINSDSGVRSGVRVQVDDQQVDVGIHFEA